MVKPEFENYFKTLKDTSEIVQKTYSDYTQLDLKQINNIIKTLENNPSDEEIKLSVNTLQSLNDKLYDEICKSDRGLPINPLIDFQVCINKLRNYADVTDETEIINHAEDGDFVQ